MKRAALHSTIPGRAQRDPGISLFKMDGRVKPGHDE